MFLSLLFTFLLAATPIIELRGAIPVAVGVWHVSLPLATVVSIAGNVAVTLALLLLLPAVVRMLSRLSPALDRFFTKLFSHTRRRAETSLVRFGEFLGLAIFVAIPLPGTGAWTGALIAFLFGITFRVALPAIALGVIVAGLLVAAATAGVIHFL